MKTEPALITGAVQAILALIVAIMALTLRQHVTPVATLNARAAAA